MNRKNLTAKQISNSYDRAARLGWQIVNESQKANFAAPAEKLASERGNVVCAAGFAAQALANLQNGDYQAFLTDLRLAGKFAQDADSEFHDRKVKP